MTADDEAITAADVAHALVGLIEETIDAGRRQEARALVVALAWMTMAWLNPPPDNRYAIDAGHLEQLVEAVIARGISNAALLDANDQQADIAEAEGHVAWLCGRALAMTDDG